MTTEVVNLKNSPYDVYIGRSRDAYHFGNPFTSKRSSIANETAASRADSIAKFRDWIHGVRFVDIEPDRREWILNNLESLRDKRLGCYCVPDDCHGHVYLELLGERGVFDLEKMI